MVKTKHVENNVGMPSLRFQDRKKSITNNAEYLLNASIDRTMSPYVYATRETDLICNTCVQIDPVLSYVNDLSSNHFDCQRQLFLLFMIRMSYRGFKSRITFLV